MTTETATDLPATEPDPRQQQLLAAPPLSPAAEAARIERQRAMAETTFRGDISPFSNGDAFKLACQIAERISYSSMIPDDYKGKPENVLIAMDYASRFPGMGVVGMMQVMDVVKGRPGLRGTFLAGLINKSPVFGRLKYEFRGTDNPGGKPSPEYGCRAYAVERETGEVIYGTWIDWSMVEAEGWSANKKWTSMREQMFQYRAAAFWSRANASDITLGMYEVEELKDLEAIDAEFTRLPSRAQRLNSATDLPKEAATGEDPQGDPDDAAPAAPAQEEATLAAKPRGSRRRVRPEGDPPPETKPADDPPPDVGEGVAAAEKVHDEVASQKAAQSQQSGFDVE